MAVFRIRVANKDAVQALYPDAVFGAARTDWMFGCEDPDCCEQHPPTDMIGVTIPGLSGSQFHKRLVAEGLTKGVRS